ncbi:hypothetical protein KCU83_g229, partial [Aureobasidium melanogenum]
MHLPEKQKAREPGRASNSSHDVDRNTSLAAHEESTHRSMSLTHPLLARPMFMFGVCYKLLFAGVQALVALAIVLTSEGLAAYSTDKRSLCALECGRMFLNEVEERLDSPLVDEMEEGEGEREPLCRASKGDSELVPGCSEGDLPLPETEVVTGREPTKVSDLARIRLRLRSNKTTTIWWSKTRYPRRRSEVNVDLWWRHGISHAYLVRGTAVAQLRKRLSCSIRRVEVWKRLLRLRASGNIETLVRMRRDLGIGVRSACGIKRFRSLSIDLVERGLLLVLIEVKARKRVGFGLRQIVRRGQVAAQVAAATIWAIKTGSASAEEATVVEGWRLEVQQGSLGVEELLLVEIVGLELLLGIIRIGEGLERVGRSRRR